MHANGNFSWYKYRYVVKRIMKASPSSWGRTEVLRILFLSSYDVLKVYVPWFVHAQCLPYACLFMLMFLDDYYSSVFLAYATDDIKIIGAPASSLTRRSFARKRCQVLQPILACAPRDSHACSLVQSLSACPDWIDECRTWAGEIHRTATAEERKEDFLPLLI